ncbi:AIPR protein [Saccharothrix carnea]|uniref:AIPR protein n=1 Tax=Saccharothrix carnea TaxID=1280637 RepID=A0A2P8IF74_SACCR|nr:AIPR family protein [Saccharothrix carnea]PSL57129.1 AIPR protein [Saccharothrix carnea]
MPTAAWNAFQARSDLQGFSPNGLVLFALELRFGIDDIAAVAATALTDGASDHKCDAVYIDTESRTAVIVQGYVSANAGRASAPSNKASDLNIAASWILGNERPAYLGSALRTAAEELDEAIRRGEIDSVELWYCHNLPESQNVALELERAARSAKALLVQRYPDVQIEARYLEVGRALLQEWYISTQSAILVSDDLEVPATGWFLEEGDGWKAVCTSVPAIWLHDLHKKHEDRLFSANVRGYMPSRRAAQNINFGIEKTASTQPGRFWAFNNGVTALVHKFEVDEERSLLQLSGIAVVNGAQTTGALARVARAQLVGAKVMIRFVQATDPALVESVIRFNNSQNPIKPSDFRSGDRHQDRLRREFEKIPDVTYLGARRGGPDDRARRPSNLIPSDTAAQALAAFHQDPGTAYHDLRSIWESDEVYSRYFSEHTSATHLVFCYSLWRAVAEAKAALTAMSEESLTSDDKEMLEYLRKRGSLHLLVAAVAAAAESFLGRAIADSFKLSFSLNVSPTTAVTYWAPLVDALLPFAPLQLGTVFENGGLRRRDNVSAAISSFRAIVNSTRRANAQTFEEFRLRVSGI